MDSFEKALNDSLFIQIKKIFIKKIEKNEWKFGNKLPSKQDIANRLNINISIINQVIESLEFEGYIKSVVGKGIYVADCKINQNITSSCSISDSLSNNRSDIKDDLINFQFIELPDSIAWKTRISDQSQVLYIEFLKKFNGKAFAIERVYLLKSFYQEVSKDLLTEATIIASIKKIRMIADARYKTFEAININENDGRFINAEINEAAMVLANEVYLHSNSIMYSETVIKGNMFRFFCTIEGRNHIMNNSSILLTRIDNRLVHGQVGVTWTKTIGANLIVVADDLVAKDELQQSLMSVTAKSSGVGIRFFTLQRTADIISKASAKQKIFIVVRSPKEARKLVELGVNLQKVNVGNMHFSQGKVALTKKIYVDDQDLEDLRFIAKSGIEVYCQDVPGEAIEIIK